MNDLNMNKQLGTKWFTFYTKVRPWLACLSTLTIVVDFIKYPEIYAETWWLLLYFFAGITQAVLSIMVFVKSSKSYVDFVQFVKKVLLFETIYIAYGQGIEQYIRNSYDLGSTLIIAVILFLIAFFVWYKLNVRYFEKRIINNYNFQHVSNEEINKIRFCRKCGFELVDDSDFCSQCGTKIIKNMEMKKNEML